MSRITWMAVFVCAFYFVKLVTAQSAVEWRKCRLGDDICSTNVTIYLLRNYASTGVSALNLRPIDPLNLESMTFKRPRIPPVLIEFNFRNLEIRGLGSVQNVSVSGFTRDVKRPISINVTLPAAVLRGSYEADGSIADRAFNGNGDFNLVLINVTDTIEINARLVKKGAKEYLSIEDVNLKMSEPLKVYYQVLGLVHGEYLNRYLNENWLQVFLALQPSMEKAFGLVVKDIISDVFRNRRYKDLFLPK